MSSGKRAAFDDPEIVERFADLVIKTAANLQPGQLLAIGSEIGKETVTRALAAAGYRHGAKFVDVAYFDLHVKRARLQYAPTTRSTTCRRGTASGSWSWGARGPPASG